ncbi:hypothetical protein BDR06DRAFT_995916 [Suillus hirtellus]|nr:hypothetical protein BDR06DRAFT_995916 [Suillus hirtellus]
MNDDNQLGDSRSVPPPDIETRNETNAAERPGRPRGKICRFLGKITNDVIAKISVQPATVQDASTGVKQGTDPQSLNAALRDAYGGANALLGPVRSVVSAGRNAPAALDDMDNMEATYLQPLRIFNTVIGEVAEVHPYAKMALGVLSCASKIILAQADRDEAILDLYKKLDFVDEHHFGTDLSTDP